MANVRPLKASTGTGTSQVASTDTVKVDALDTISSGPLTVGASTATSIAVGQSVVPVTTHTVNLGSNSKAFTDAFLWDGIDGRALSDTTSSAPGAELVGIHASDFSNFTPGANNVYSALRAVDTSLAGAAGAGPTVDDFVNGGDGWKVDSFTTVEQIPSISPTMPSSGVIRLVLGTSDGILGAPGWGRVLGTIGPIVCTWRSTFPFESSAVNDTQCQYSFGVLSQDTLSGVLFNAAWVSSARVWSLVTLKSGTVTSEAITLSISGKSYFDVRLTIGLTGTTVEISLDDGPFTTLVVGSVAPDQVTYIPVIISAKITTPALDRALLVDRLTWTGPAKNNDGTPDSGNPWPVGGLPSPHHITHQHGGTDEVATATPAANAIPKADGSSKLDSWISLASTSVRGLIGLSTSTPNAISTTGSAGASGNAADSLHTHAITAATIISAMASAASSLAMNAQKITGVANPASAQDAATKNYVDHPALRDVGLGGTDTLLVTDIGCGVKYSKAGAVAVTLSTLASGYVSGTLAVILIMATDAATALTITPSGAGVQINGSTSAWSPTAGPGVYSLSSYDGLKWFH